MAVEKATGSAINVFTGFHTNVKSAYLTRYGLLECVSEWNKTDSTYVNRKKKEKSLHEMASMTVSTSSESLCREISELNSYAVSLLVNDELPCDIVVRKSRAGDNGDWKNNWTTRGPCSIPENPQLPPYIAFKAPLMSVTFPVTDVIERKIPEDYNPEKKEMLLSIAESFEKKMALKKCTGKQFYNAKKVIDVGTGLSINEDRAIDYSHASIGVICNVILKVAVPAGGRKVMSIEIITLRYYVIKDSQKSAENDLPGGP
jgi:hypothetical protein